MKKGRFNIFPAMLMILFGVFLLLNNMRVFDGVEDLLLGAGIGFMGLLALGFYFRSGIHWWFLFPSFIAIGIGAGLVAGDLPYMNMLEPGIFLFSLSLAFWTIFVREKAQWWAGIPAGVLTTIAAAVSLAYFVPIHMGIFIMIGIGLTFAMLWLLRGDADTAWAKFPALGLFLLAGINAFFADIEVVGPLILIGAGVWLLFGGKRGRGCHHKKQRKGKKVHINAT